MIATGGLQKLLVVGTVGLLTVGSTPEFASGAEAERFEGTFSASASSDAMRLSLVVPSAPPTDTVLDLGGPSAQSTLDHLGDSRAFASFPYPGETIVTGPGLFRGATGINIPGEYPFYVRSFHPAVPKSEFGSGPYALKAESNAESSTATATVGLSTENEAAGVAKSDSGASTTKDQVKAEAKSQVTSFAVGPLQIGEVLAKAKAVLDVDGAIRREADLRITGAQINGIPVTITREGVTASESKSPLGIAPVTEALAAAGITAVVMPRTDVPEGVSAPTLVITRREPSGQSVEYRLGSAAAYIGGASIAGVPVDGSVPEDSSSASPAEPSSASPPPTPSVAHQTEPGKGNTLGDGGAGFPDTGASLSSGTLPTDSDAVSRPGSSIADVSVADGRSAVAGQYGSGVGPTSGSRSNQPNAVRAVESGPRSFMAITSALFFEAGDIRPLLSILALSAFGVVIIAGLMRRVGKEP